MNLRHLLLVAVAAALVAVSPALAVSPVNKSLLGGVAIDGYDPVAYFTAGRPVEGSKEHSFEWEGATWRFASAENRGLFAKEPGKYAPQYGGYCAYAIANGYTADIDPDAWTIHEGKLYLNYDEKIEAKWRADKASFIAKADANWPKLLAD